MSSNSNIRRSFFQTVYDRRARRLPSVQSGFSLIELMIAIAISLLILAALTTLFVNISQSNNELAKTNSQIENGRFAVQLLEGDIVHAGFWGQLRYVPAPETPSFPAATAIPDPCLAVASWDAAYKANLLAIPVQGFANAATLTACGLGTVLASSDVLVVNHANNCVAGAANCDGGTDTGPHIQGAACVSDGPHYVISSTAGDFVLRNKNCTTAAERRKIISNIYYLATNNGVPTLMRVSRVNGAYVAPQPLIEGIEAFRVEYGIDSLGKNGLPISATNYPDGSADQFVSCAPCTLAQLSNVVAVKIHLLARNLEPTLGYTDSKSYQLGATSIAAFGDQYKRHVFSTTIRLVNPSARREMP